jgi:hypothetical protein
LYTRLECYGRERVAWRPAQQTKGVGNVLHAYAVFGVSGPAGALSLAICSFFALI